MIKWLTIGLYLLNYNICLSIDSTFTYKKSPYIKKYCLAYNTFYNKIIEDNNIYLYTNVYNNKHDYFIYVNYFDRVNIGYSDNKIKSASYGLFYDYMLSKKVFIWTFYQGEIYLNEKWNTQQIANGLGYYLINNKRCYITINNGFLYKRIIDKNEYRYLFRVKSRISFKKCYFETYNYIQPSFNKINDINFITFNTFTLRIKNKLNFKIYHWLNFNSLYKNEFNYIIIGFSFENW